MLNRIKISLICIVTIGIYLFLSPLINKYILNIKNDIIDQINTNTILFSLIITIGALVVEFVYWVVTGKSFL